MEELLVTGVGYLKLAVEAVGAAIVGFGLSVPFDLPSGPAIIAVSGFFALIAWLVRLVRAG